MPRRIQNLELLDWRPRQLRRLRHEIFSNLSWQIGMVKKSSCPNAPFSLTPGKRENRTRLIRRYGTGGALASASNGRVCHSHERLPVACLESNLALKFSLVPIQRCVATVRATNHLLTFYRSGASVA